MNVIVPRTCVEILQESPSQIRETAPVALESFQQAPAYVLLGDPGSGKSTAFRIEAEAMGHQALLISARDFQTFGVGSHPEWRGKTLFIDGLDEIRVGSGNRREALDNIRRRLDALGRPSFRISCREADWLGDNDREKLNAVSPPGARIRVLRLNLLIDVDIEQILNAHPEVDDPRQFMADAEENRVDGLLTNPLTLDMLARAVGGGHSWPESRLQTFDMACRQMATEYNDEHIAGGPPPPTERLLDIASLLCAHLLISGAAGCSINYNETNTDYIDLDRFDAETDRTARYALTTRLFASVTGGRFAPAHRHIAEFLGARYLAKLIDGGLPIGRILAMITAGDGIVVTVLRGLSAWLAVHCPAARERLIDSDPVGVGLYGDLQGFCVDDKRRLLLALNREVADNGIHASAFGALASSEMECTLRDFLNEPRRDTDHQLVIEFLLRILRHGPPPTRLCPVLLKVVYDDSRWPRVVSAALDAFIHTSTEVTDGSDQLRQLLVDVEHGLISDPDNELLGRLLTRLYPQEIPPSEIWRYLTTRGNPDLIGAYFVFWERRLLEQSSDEDVATLLDSLSSLMPDLRTVFRVYYLDRLPLRLLARVLERLGDAQDPARLYDWLNAGSYPFWDPPRLPGESTTEIRTWLEQRPDVQKDVFLEGLTRCPDDDGFDLCTSEVWYRLHDSTPPPDFGLWCLDTAVACVDTNSRVADQLLRYAVHYCDRSTGGQGLSRAVLEERTSGHCALRQRLTELLTPPVNVPAARPPRRVGASRPQVDHEWQRWVDLVKANADALRESRASPQLLFGIGMAYFGHFPFSSANIPSERGLEGILGSDDLVEAAKAGLRGVVWREDVPEIAEIIRLAADSHFHPLGPPFLAGMDEMGLVEPEQLERLSSLQMQQALAFHYCTPTGRSTDPGWYLTWIESCPELVADVLVRCAIPAVRSGKGHVPELYQLIHQESYGGVAAHASPLLLASFPLRCSLRQLETLDGLLWSALQHADRSSLQGMIEEKLSRSSLNVAQRIHWLAAGVVVAPDIYLRPLESFVVGRDDRIRRMAAFFAPDEDMPFLVEGLDVQTLGTLIAQMGRVFEPVEASGWVTAEMRATGQIDRLVHCLSSLPGDNASRVLEELSTDETLSKWRLFLERARYRQRVIHRDSSYQHPSTEQVRQALNNGAPANAADLAALVVRILEKLVKRIRANDTQDWRQYWNEGARGRAQSPKIEEHCRDALLSDLQHELPVGVIAQPEVEFANNRRADIGVSYGGFRVPVEIKKSQDPQLWSALRNQLIQRYVSSPITGGHGIYLVFWFGERDIPAPPQGRRPANPEELRQRLEAPLSEAERRRISVCVVDVSPAG